MGNYTYRQNHRPASFCITIVPVSLIRITSFVIFLSYLLSYGRCNERDDRFEIAREKRSESNPTQRWNLRFERDRVLGNCKSVVVPWTRPPMPLPKYQPSSSSVPTTPSTTQPIPSSKYPPSPSVPTTPSTTQPIPSSKYPPSPSVPTNPPTRWDQVSTSNRTKPSYFQMIFRFKNVEKKIVIKYG